MTDKKGPAITDWQSLVKKETKGRTADELVWQTPEGIVIKPLYTAEDTKDLEHMDNLSEWGHRAITWVNF